MLQEHLTIRKSLNKAYLKVKPTRTQIETFKAGLISLFNQVKESESEEYHKNIIAEFLKNTYYHPAHYINTKGRTDLVIHNGKDSKSTVGVIIETKRPANKAEMPTKGNLNSKAVHELVLYYLKERISNKNLEIKYLIATNLYEWFIFNAQDFEKVFARNKKLVADFEKFEAGSLSGTTTDFFYNEISKPFIDEQGASIPVTWFDLRHYETIVTNDSKEDDKKLIEIYKVLSPEHLLKLSFSNDSNTLDKRFYNELLHIIGLEERKEGSKKLIGRKAEGKRDNGSLIENAINILNYEDCLRDIKNLSDYGENKEDQLYHVALELSITWINRILFLKLLEGQLVRYHNGDSSFKFLNAELIQDYDALNKLFFHVLAVKENERGDHVKEKYKKIPYLNSSLFEPNELEHRTIRISNLEDDYTLPTLSGTVLKDNTGKKKTGSLNPLSYLFDFLDAYDFSSEGAEDISEENKTLINASVLGLIFEKINGYKDGSFFTPGFITMYMCRETIRRAVVQKFNDSKGWNCENLDELYNKIDDLKNANDIINSLKICDPAVGSGHFLVSALNEIIAIKSELKVLIDSSGRRLKNYHIEVINDELVITDEDGEFFEYRPKNPESQRIQETLFHEKQTIIENCLFGVDINQNSVKICRLRLWIELLKNAYYRPDSGYSELETLPNIDINIKCGNSLISRYPLDADIKSALAKSKWTIDSYRLAIMSYRNAENKEEKASMRRLIDEIKSDFESEVARNDKRLLKANKLKGELSVLTGQQSLFALSKKEKAEWEKKVKKISEHLDKLDSELEEIKHNKIYKNAFEWRFEFPEILNDDGDFFGFDVVIGNPPYIRQENFSELKPYLRDNYSVYNSISDLLTYFVELGVNILRPAGVFQFIISNKFTRANYGKELRKYLLDNISLTHFIDFSGIPVFDEATVDSAVLGFSNLVKNRSSQIYSYANIKKYEFSMQDFNSYLNTIVQELLQDKLTINSWAFESEEVLKIKQKVERQGIPLKDWNITINYGLKTGLNEAFVINNEKKNELIKIDSKSEAVIKPLLRGRDLGKYLPNFQNLYLIYIPWHFPLHNDQDITGASWKAETEFKNNYPAIYSHLETYKEKLSKRNKAETNIRYEWYALQRFGANYWQDFNKPKIIYPNMTKYLPFSIDLKYNFYHNDKSFHLISERIYWLASFLNSTLFKYCFIDNFAELLGGTRELRKVFFEPIPVKQISEKEEYPFKELIKTICDLKECDFQSEITEIENEIDRLVYNIYELTEEEIKIIEESIKLK
ncbi:MAG: Eco57I restriction-modification methylase domain-containing protein [Bacteroidota bacterium]